MYVDGKSTKTREQIKEQINEYQPLYYTIMKKSTFILAIVAVVIVTITAALVSCKKENKISLNRQSSNEKEVFDLRKIDDINAYLKDFRLKLVEGKDGESMNIDEAAWHLACLVNQDLCNAGVEFNDVRFDTIEMQVVVNNGVMEMKDLRTAYEQMIPEIQSFEGSLNLDNQNLRFVNVFLSDNGKARIALMTTSTSMSRYLDDTLWYFPETFGYMDSICDHYFVASSYHWKNTARAMLQTDLNAIEGRNTSSIYGSCYFPTRSYSFDFRYWTDSFGSPFNGNSRLCVVLTKNSVLSKDEMCYSLDSYLGLGYEYLNNNYYVNNEVPLTWTVDTYDSVFPNDNLRKYYHILSVQYGIPATVNPDPYQ